ncbi:MAG TPA: hypothetical protein VEK08_19630 [Planctomycetota bacterium]|nr:hypothetical protein [Planctomycetota bacterium]
MLKITALVLVLLACVAARAAKAAGATDEFKNVWEAKDAAFKAEEKGLWKKINWYQVSEVALRDAQKLNKPIMVFLLVGKNGQKEAPEC